MNTKEILSPANGVTPAAVPVTPVAAGGDTEERELRMAGIDPNPEQPRKESDLGRDKELEASIQTHGLLYAIIVYLVAATGRYRIVDGERRYRAYQRLGKETIRARILQKPPDDIQLKEIQLIGNEQRLDLHDIERGEAFLEYLELTGCTATALARKMGKPVSNITRAVSLVKKLPKDIRARVGTKLPPSVAQLLTALDDEDEKRRFASLYVEGKIKSGDELAAAIKAARKGQFASGTSGFSCEESGVKIACTWSNGSADAQALANVENALRILLKDLASQKHRGLTHWKHFLDKKAKAARKADELKSAQDALAGLANPTAPVPPNTAK